MVVIFQNVVFWILIHFIWWVDIVLCSQPTSADSSLCRRDTMTVHSKYEIVFVVRLVHNMQTQALGSLQHFLMLQWVVHKVTTGPYIFNVANIHIFFSRVCYSDTFSYLYCFYKYKGCKVLTNITYFVDKGGTWFVLKDPEGFNLGQ
jgi:hypothetical protein